MNSIRSFFARLYNRLFAVTVAAALADLEKAQTKLRKAAKAHADKADTHLFAVEQHQVSYTLHAQASARADRVANKLADLTS